MWSTLRQQCLLLFIAGLVFFVNLGKAQLWDDDEPKNAQCAREMLARGDWIVPCFNGELRCDKPVLVYWLMISAYQSFGDTEFAARLPSALAALGTALLTFHLGRILFRTSVGFWSGSILATSLMFVIVGRAATPDSLMIFFTTLAMLLFVRATWGRQATLAGANRLADYLPRRWTGMVPVYAAMALGVLTKGPVAAVVPILALVGYVATVRQSLSAAADAPFGRRCSRLFAPWAWIVAGWRLRPFTAALILALIALPWYLLVTISTGGEWLAGFWGQHNVGRYLNAMEGHRGPFWYYLPAVLFGLFPWSIFLPQAVVRAVREVRHSPAWAAWLFLICWATAWIGFFSCSGTKLPSYAAPAFPALAIMLGTWIDGWLSDSRLVNRWFLRQSIVSFGFIGVLHFVALPTIDFYVLPGEAVLGLVGVPLVAGAVAGLICAVRRPRWAATALAAGTVGYLLATFGWAGVRASRHQNSPALVDALAACDQTLEPAAFDLAVPSFVYYSRRRVPQLHETDDALHHLRSSPRAVVVTHTRGYEQLVSRLPRDVAVVARRQRFLRTSEVIVLGHAGALARSTHEPVRRSAKR